MSIRKSAVAGTFYPDSKEAIKEFFNTFESLLQQQGKKQKITPKAVIVPHAGYPYSGFSASTVYANLAKSYKKVVVIGPSHRVYFKGCSVSDYEKYATPLGDLEIDTQSVNALQEQFSFCSFLDEAHYEHSTETQMPFIKQYQPTAKIVEIVYADIKADELEQLINAVSDQNTLIVISSDLSHFYDLKKANSIDTLCLEAIEKLDTGIENSGCEACGILGIAALLSFAKKQRLQPKLMDYRTSYDGSGDKNSVVGYASAIFY